MRKDYRRDYQFESDEKAVISFRGVRKFAVITALVFGVAYLASTFMSSDFLPIRSVRVNGNLEYVDQKRVEQLVTPLIKGNFFTVNIKLIHEAIRQQIWVERVSVQRIWPDTLKIEIAEARPLARWSAGGLITVDGKHLAAEGSELLSNLPYFKGPDRYYTVMAQRYKTMEQAFARINLKIEKVVVSQRRAWLIRLKNGIEVRLGRDNIVMRVKRLTRVFEKVLKDKVEDIQAIDLRYTNGFAVQWKSSRKTKRYAFEG